SQSYLEIVWNNLLSNAVKFTESGKIIVSLKKDNGQAIVKISDTGCGISAETGKHIFEKFYQGDASHSQEGNGLGLALVKKVIDVIGGTVSVSSEIGKGSTFTVTLKQVL
ncbi:MAG: sensor histidine kinase, partial [Clostridia bacterium]|nr:sensor histidine kinase [Clostridia bacterium]